jgi:hypothetical protein
VQAERRAESLSNGSGPKRDGRSMSTWYRGDGQRGRGDQERQQDAEERNAEHG